MAVSPIQARCRRCNRDFHLFELLDARSGCCPRCGWELTPDWTHQLLKDAARADLAQRHLVAAARALSHLPGNLLVRPTSVLRNLFEEVGWERELREDPDLLVIELNALRKLVDAWEDLLPIESAPMPTGGWMHRVIRRLTTPKSDLARTYRLAPGD